LALLVTPFISRAKFEGGNNVSVDEVIDENLFVTGNVMTIDGVINGDVFAAGNNVIISGVVNGDVFAAANTIEISGEVNGNLRLVASNVSINGKVERNVLVAGANLIISKTGEVGRHLNFTGASLVLNGPVGGRVEAEAASADLNNSIGSGAVLNLGEDGELTISSGASVKGDLEYTAGKKAEIKEGAEVSGKVIYKPWKADKAPEEEMLGFLRGGSLASRLIGLVALFIVGLLLLRFMPKPLNRIYEEMTENFWFCIGLGLVVLILTPIICVLLLFTVVGIPLALIILAIYAIFLYVSKVVGALIFGKLILDGLKVKSRAAIDLLIGLIALTLIAFIPFVGWLFGLLILIWALGGWFKIRKELLEGMK
jgi:cytoskeletal protein CcmA (bactofilin family)